MVCGGASATFPCAQETFETIGPALKPHRLAQVGIPLIPATLLALLQGELDVRGYLRSLRNCQVEAVFTHEDPLPGLAEILLIPYLMMKRGF